MLIDEFLAYKNDFTYPDGTRYAACLERIRRRLRQAQAFVLDRDAVAMAANVSLSKPSSIVSALPWIKLPFDSTWIEFSNIEFRDAMTEAGSPNVKPEGTKAEIRKTGFLLREKRGVIQADYIHLDRAVIGGQTHELPDLAPIRLYYTLNADPDIDAGVPEIDPARFDPNLVEFKIRGRMRNRFKLLADDPAELRAEVSLKSRAFWGPHPDMAPIAEAMVKMTGEANTRQLEEYQAEEASRLFSMAILPALILLNCRNAVDVETVPAPEKLNKQRILKGKEPLLEHRIVKMHLSEARKRSIARLGSAEARRAARGTLVMGHYKVRKSGIFWWRPHARSGHGKVRRTIVLTA